MTREIIFSSENLKVVDRPEDGETVILTFSPLGFTVVGDSFWGAELFDRVNLSAIGFVATSANWFPPDDMEAAFPAVRARIAGRKVITYGHSQGAYAALKFAKQLGARTAVAFSPQWSINPSDVKAFDRRYEKNYDPNLRNGERIDEGDLCRQSFVIVDRADKEDVVHADILAKLSGVTCIPSPFSGHNTIVPVAEGGQGRPLMHLFTKSDGIQASDIRQLLRNARRKSDTYRRTRIDQLLEHLPRHQKIYEIALSAIPDGAEKTMTKVLGQVAAAQMQAAAVTMAEVSDEALAKFNLFRFWTAFRRAGFDVGERRIAPIFKFAHANSVFARLHGVTSMIKFGLSGEALEELSALSADPNADSCRRFFLDHYNRLDRMDLASAFLDKLFECGQITLERRLEEGIRVAGTLRARNRSADATYELMALYRLCKGDLHKTLELIGAALIGLVLITEYYKDKDQNKDRFTLTDDGHSYPHPDGLGEYTTMTSIGDVAAYVLRKTNVKSPVTSADLAKIVANQDAKYLFPPGDAWHVTGDGLLERGTFDFIDSHGNRPFKVSHQYKVYSDGKQVIVASQPDGKFISVPL